MRTMKVRKLSDDVTWFPLDGFEVGIESDAGVVALGLYQVQLDEQQIRLCGSTMTPEQAQRIANALLSAVAALRDPAVPSKH